MENEKEVVEIIPSIHLYKDPSAKTLNLSDIARYIRENLGEIEVDEREPLIGPEGPIEQLAIKLARAKVRSFTDPDFVFEPLRGEIEYEKKLILSPEKSPAGILYDGFKLQDLLRDLLPAEELSIEHLHIVFTNRLPATWDERDRRYHARVSVYGFPTIISTTGIVEAPAKPKEYYLLKRHYAAIGFPNVPLEILKEKFRGRFIDYDDERLTEVMKGYVMQAIFYHVFGDPFCDKPFCRLYNSHWQEEVLKSQLEQPEFCETHERTIKFMRASFRRGRGGSLQNPPQKFLLP
ncbi:MAG: DUF6775 family putative metallopeptidase [Candidatus Methanomethylicaceae archaeon]